MKHTITSPAWMIVLGKTLAKQGHTHILLSGYLGAGKTHFTKWFVQWLGLDDRLVTSPTYSYSNSYNEQVLHCDFYRLENKEELRSKWLLDAIENHDNVLIEWPKWEATYADEDWLSVTIEIVDETTREVTVLPFS